MTLQWLLGWWNLIFILPFGLGLLYLGVYTLSGWTFGEADVDHDLSVDHDVAIDHDVAVDHDADLSHDVAAETDADSDADQDTAAAGHDASAGALHGSMAFTMLNWLGVGRVPVSLILMIMLLAWGLIGFAANQLMIDRPVMVLLPVSLGAAFFGTLLITRVLTLVVGKYLPTNETYARPLEALIGSEGEALYPIDAKFGMVGGRDNRGEYFQLPCRTLPNRTQIAKGTKVTLAVYDEQSGLFSVIPADGETN